VFLNGSLHEDGVNMHDLHGAMVRNYDCPKGILKAAPEIE
jgi:hypothetical protein